MELRYINKFTDKALSIIPDLGLDNFKFIRATGTIKKYVIELFSKPVEERKYVVVRPIEIHMRNNVKTTLWDVTDNEDLAKYNMVAILVDGEVSKEVIWLYAELFSQFKNIAILTNFKESIKNAKDILELASIIDNIRTYYDKLTNNKKDFVKDTYGWEDLILSKIVELESISDLTKEQIVGLTLPTFSVHNTELLTLSVRGISKTSIPFDIEFVTDYPNPPLIAVNVNITVDDLTKPLLPLLNGSYNISNKMIDIFNLKDTTEYYKAVAVTYKHKRKYPILRLRSYRD